MKKTVLKAVPCILLLILFAVSGFAADKTVTMIADPWAPYYSKDLPGHGFAADVIREALARKSYKVTFTVRPWKRSLKMVEEGKYDAIATAWYSDERAQKYTFSKPYGECRIVFFTKKENPLQWNNFKDLKGKKIGVVRNYAYSPEFSQATFLQKDEADNIVINIKKLIKNRTDTILMDKYVGLYTLKKDFPEQAGTIVYSDKPVSLNKLYCMFSKKVPGVDAKREAFNSGLAEIMADGTFDKILMKHNLK